MKGIIILGSARGDGNTALVTEQLQQLTGFDVINLLDYNINYYDYNHSSLDDDFVPLMEKITKQYDTIVFATPVYWYSMSAQLKTFFDRISDLLRVRKDLGRLLRGKQMAMICCGYANDLIDGFDLPFVHSADYLGMNYLGYCYTWNGEGQPLCDEVQARIQQFSKLFT